MTDGERLAVIESLLREFIDSQRIHNDAFYVVRDQVRDMKAGARGAWWTIGIFGSLTVAVSTGVAWLVSIYIGGKQ